MKVLKTEAQIKALHELVKELEGSSQDPIKMIKQEEKYAPLRKLSNEELNNTLLHVGNVDQCEDCDLWVAIEELNGDNLCSSCH